SHGNEDRLRSAAQASDLCHLARFSDCLTLRRGRRAGSKLRRRTAWDGGRIVREEQGCAEPCNAGDPPFQGEVWTLAQPFCPLAPPFCAVARRTAAAPIGAMLTLIHRLSPRAALCAPASPALAQPDPAADYPNHPVRIIVSTSAGGGVDTVTRIIGAALQEKLGQPFVIEDRGGGGGNIAAEAGYTADPGGYTLLASQPPPITSNIALYKKLNFDPAALESVAVLSKIPNLLLVRQDFPAKTVAEFIAYAKAHPGGVTFASQGPGTTSHLSGEQFSQLLGARM